MLVMRPGSLLLAALLVGAMVSGCAEEKATDRGATTGPSSAPPTNSLPVPPGLVSTPFAVTVLDDGDGAELCLGGVADSLPPQCGGPALVGWDWTEHVGDFEEASGVRWGDFAVTGTFDGTSFTPTEVVPADEFDAPPYDEDETRFGTPCPEPDGGWVVDAAKTDARAQEAAFQRASQLEGYAGAFVDESWSGASREGGPIVNVRIVGDTEAAKSTLREVWGGGLCVIRAVHTERELRAIQDELVDAIPGLLGGSVEDEVVVATVIYDDGSLQRLADDKYGDGLVLVESVLTDVR